ncbi:hypothetical protein LWM68_36330 [Niabella sp. W65]|nr:hypothetical protein [Niabella sp. W65]MCH7367738.1 hypothetical protein [Niabella sp. W65]
MFDTLAQYLFEFKSLALPPIGSFELEDKGAAADFAASTIAAPSWVIIFKPYYGNVETGGNSTLSSWLAANEKMSVNEAEGRLNNFIADLQSRLNSGEPVNWPQLGTLVKKGTQIYFEPAAAYISPFTDVTAKKSNQENASHHTLVGDRETTTAQMREQLLLPDEKKKKAPHNVGIIRYFTDSGGLVS